MLALGLFFMGKGGMGQFLFQGQNWVDFQHMRKKIIWAKKEKMKKVNHIKI